MDIWLFNPYGPLPGESWRYYRFAFLGTELAKRGHNVVWWTANYSHHFKERRSDGWKDKEIAKGFVVRLVPVISYRKNIGAGRVGFELSYAINAYRKAVMLKVPQLIIGVDPPQVVGFLCGRLSNKMDIPLIIDVFDLWPELFALALPKIFRKYSDQIFFPLRLFRRYNLDRADNIITLCETYLEMVRRESSNHTDDRIFIVYNGIDVGEFRAILSETSINDDMGIIPKKTKEEIWAIYAGSLGPNYDIRCLIEASEYLANRAPNVKIIIAGDGPMKRLIIERSKDPEYKNLVYAGSLDVQKLIRLYGECAIGICAYGLSSNVAMPDKVYDYMAAGLPIVSSLRGELERIIFGSHLGLNYKAGDPKSLALALIQLAVNKEERLLMSKNSFEKAREYDKKDQYLKYVEIIESLQRKGRATKRLD